MIAEPSGFRLPFTICMIIHNDRILLLRRKHPPFAGQLNGVGGKLHPGEAPLDCVLREVLEETGVVLKSARFTGIVTWEGFVAGAAGMYAYVADLPPGIHPSAVAGPTEEGELTWEEIASVIAGRGDVVDNIPSWLGPMLEGAQPAEYILHYDGTRFLGCESKALA